MMPAKKKRIQSNAMRHQTITLCRCSRDSASVRCLRGEVGSSGEPACLAPVLLEVCSSLVFMGIASYSDFERCLNCRFLLSIISLPPAELDQRCCWLVLLIVTHLIS